MTKVPQARKARSPPHLVGDLDDHPQLRPLLLLGENVALFGGGEAALGRQAQLIEVNKFGRLIEAAFDRVLVFQRACFASDKSEHHALALRHKTQWLEAAGAR